MAAFSSSPGGRRPGFVVGLALDAGWLAHYLPSVMSHPTRGMPLHPAADLFDRRPLVFTAHSAETAYLSERICAFVLDRDAVPVNPWMVSGYFLYGLVDKDLVRRANNNLLMRSDELWVFTSGGEAVADGVRVEIDWAVANDRPVRRFHLDHYGESIIEVTRA
jgi:hypothetical protein